MTRKPSNLVSSKPISRAITRINANIPAGEYLVYYFQPRDRIRCDLQGAFLDGSNEAGVLFERLEDADAFARSVPIANPRIGSGVYNSSWQTVAEYLSDLVIEQRAKAESPRRLLLWAGALLISGSLFLWIEARSGWTVMFGFLIGARLLLSGVFKLAKGLHRLKRR